MVGCLLLAAATLHPLTGNDTPAVRPRTRAGPSKPAHAHRKWPRPVVPLTLWCAVRAKQALGDAALSTPRAAMRGAARCGTCLHRGGAQVASAVWFLACTGEPRCYCACLSLPSCRASGGVSGTLHLGVNCPFRLPCSAWIAMSCIGQIVAHRVRPQSRAALLWALHLLRFQALCTLCCALDCLACCAAGAEHCGAHARDALSGISRMGGWVGAWAGSDQCGTPRSVPPDASRCCVGMRYMPSLPMHSCAHIAMLDGCEFISTRS